MNSWPLKVRDFPFFFTKKDLSSFVGPQFHLPAAMAFYRALRIYPNPMDLLGIYQKTIVEPVFKVRHFQPLFIVRYLNLMYLSLL